MGWNGDDAAFELEDRGFTVTVTTVAATGDQVDTVLAQDPAGGRAARGLDGHDHGRGEGVEGQGLTGRCQLVSNAN